MKIGVMGSGAVGSFYGSLLSEAGHDVTYIARGAHLEAMQKEGLVVYRGEEKTTITETFTDDIAALANCDLILMCVKSGDTKENAVKLKEIISPTTHVMSLQNGVSNEEVLLDVFNEKQVLSAVVYVQAAVESPGVVKQNSRYSLVIGALVEDNQEIVDSLVAQFNEANIPSVPSKRVMVRKWKKYLWNLMFNPLSAATEQSVGVILDDPHLKSIVDMLGLESVKIAQALGYSLGEKDVEDAIESADKYARKHATSMLQDIQKGKVTEAEEMVGYLLRKAEEHGENVNATKTVYSLLKNKENQLI